MQVIMEWKEKITVKKYIQYAFYKKEEMGIHTYKHIVAVAV